ncbi:MAG: glycosyltransferase [Burkholderiaceae bacterium]|nr:glycosyltransferase [Burkholderiaceae bacterium]
MSVAQQLDRLLAAPVQLSVVTPAYRESANLATLHAALCELLDAQGLIWEWIVVDDHSPDDTFDAIAAIARRDQRVRGLRLSRNGGSHNAIAVGLDHARGSAAVVLAADLQDPPRIIPALLAQWSRGAQVVWATRRAPNGASRFDRLSARAFHALMRRIGGFESMPAFGSDCFLLDRVAIDALCEFGERRANLIALVHWMGFRQAQVPYDKAPRVRGRSGWSLARKLELALDSVIAFSVRPIRWMTIAGALTALAGFVWAAVVLVNAIAGAPPTGWSSLIIAVLAIGGLQMLMIGVLGEYLWRALEESRRRPRALIEAATGVEERTDRASRADRVEEGPGAGAQRPVDAGRSGGAAQSLRSSHRASRRWVR